MSEEKKSKSLNKYIQLTGIAFQMMGVIFAFVWLGKWLDGYYEHDKKYFTALGSLLGLAASLYLVLNQLRNVK